MYFDSYGPNGGEPFYDMARTITQTAGTTGYKGWKSNDSQKARYWFMENHTNSAYEALHSVYYFYYRMGLDMMTKDQNTARKNIHLFVTKPIIIFYIEKILIPTIGIYLNLENTELLLLVL